MNIHLFYMRGPALERRHLKDMQLGERLLKGKEIRAANSGRMRLERLLSGGVGKSHGRINAGSLL